MRKNIQEEKETRPKSIGLALGGGGARGLAHIGVLKALTETKIPINYIAGTSMGALVGGWYAARQEVATLEAIFSKIQDGDVKSILQLLRHGGQNTLFRDPRIIPALENKIKKDTVQSCKIPFRAIATDVRTGDEMILEKGSLVEAIRASTALPVAFTPVVFDDKHLIDGGFVNPVPADVVRGMGAEYVIAIDVSSSWHDFSTDRPKNISEIVAYTLQAVEYQLTRKSLTFADAIVRPPVLQFSLFSFRNAKDIIDAGYRETKLHIREILKNSGLPLPKQTLFEKFMEFLTYGFDE